MMKRIPSKWPFATHRFRFQGRAFSDAGFMVNCSELLTEGRAS